MLAEIKRWGNSCAIRLTKEDLERLGVQEGDRVKVDLHRLPAKGKVDLSDMPTFADPDPKASQRHDDYLYGDRDAADA